MKYLLIAILSLPLATFSQSSGKDGGNGGFVYQCGSKMELVDLMEVRYIPGLKELLPIERSDSLTVEEIIDEKIEFLNKVDSRLGPSLENYIKEMMQKIRPRKWDDVVDPTDYGRVPEVAGCKLVNLIKYTDAPLARASLYFKLKTTDKSALIIHEALYERARRIALYGGYELPDSVPVRRMVAMMFSKNREAHIPELKELLNFYLKGFGQDGQNTYKLRACFEKKYLENYKIQMNNKFWKNLDMTLIERSSPDDPAAMSILLNEDLEEQWKKKVVHWYPVERETKVHLDSMKKQATACDGSEGQSVVLETGELKTSQPVLLNVMYQFDVGFFSSFNTKNYGEVDGTMKLSLIDGQNNELEVISRSYLNGGAYGFIELGLFRSMKRKKLSKAAKFFIEN